jgi:cytochrome c peroxidase
MSARVPATLIVVSVLVFFSIYSCSKQQSNTRPEGLSDLFQALPTSVVDPPDNPGTPEKIDLGRMLFFDARLSRSKLTSCNTCHDLTQAGVDHLTRSIGEGIGQRNTPSVFNTAFLGTISLEETTKEFLRSHEEMDLTAIEAVERVREAGYLPYFTAAFPTESDPLTFNNIAHAIAAFSRTLITPNASFDRYIAGDVNALTERQKIGLTLFQDNGCVACHSGPLLGGTLFTKFSHLQEQGMSHDFGAFQVSGEPSDQFVFRVSPLRNVALTAPYFHNGSILELDEAVRIMGKAQLGFTLSEQDITDMVDFLNSLTGEFPVVEAPRLP